MVFKSKKIKVVCISNTNQRFLVTKAVLHLATVTMNIKYEIAWCVCQRYSQLTKCQRQVLLVYLLRCLHHWYRSSTSNQLRCLRSWRLKVVQQYKRRHIQFFSFSYAAVICIFHFHNESIGCPQNLSTCVIEMIAVFVTRAMIVQQCAHRRA